MRYFTLTWDEGKYTRTIIHPPSALPVIGINDDNSILTTICSYFKSLLKRNNHHEKCEKILYTKGATNIKIEQMARYSKKGHVATVELLDLNEDNTAKIKLKNGREILTEQVFLSDTDEPDISTIPTTHTEYEETCKFLTLYQIETIRNPTKLSDNQQSFLKMHEHLNHLNMRTMMKLAKKNILPKKYIELEKDLSVCMSCILGQAHKRPWRHK